MLPSWFIFGFEFRSRVLCPIGFPLEIYIKVSSRLQRPLRIRRKDTRQFYSMTENSRWKKFSSKSGQLHWSFISAGQSQSVNPPEYVHTGGIEMQLISNLWRDIRCTRAFMTPCGSVLPIPVSLCSSEMEHWTKAGSPVFKNRVELCWFEHSEHQIKWALLLWQMRSPLHCNCGIG